MSDLPPPLLKQLALYVTPQTSHTIRACVWFSWTVSEVELWEIEDFKSVEFQAKRMTENGYLTFVPKGHEMLGLQSRASSRN